MKIGATLVLWDFVLLILRVIGWFKYGNGPFVLNYGGAPYKGSFIVSLIVFYYSVQRSLNRTNCDDSYPGLECSYEGSTTSVESWTNEGVSQNTWDCVGVSLSLAFLSFWTHKVAPKEFGLRCFNEETKEWANCEDLQVIDPEAPSSSDDAPAL